MNRKRMMQIAAAMVLLALVCAVVIYWKTRPKLISFTFDDGPSDYTEVLLDGLESRNVPVTFFMNGENGTGGTCGIKNGHEALLSRMWEGGHQLANHTDQHANLDDLPPEQIAAEVSNVEELIFSAAGGSYDCFVRTPGGHINAAITDNVNAPIILWNVDTLDWKFRDADYVYNKILSCAKNGSIVLMHDIYETSVEGALRAVDTLKEQGYEFVTVSELMRRTGTRLTDGTAYSKAEKAVICRPAYEAPKVKVSESDHSGFFEITCQEPSGLPVYYTTDGSYPRLSDQMYSGAVLVEPGTEFMAVGIDQWGMRTPLAAVTAGEKEQ